MRTHRRSEGRRAHRDTASETRTHRRPRDTPVASLLCAKSTRRDSSQESFSGSPHLLQLLIFSPILLHIFCSPILLRIVCSPILLRIVCSPILLHILSNALRSCLHPLLPDPPPRFSILHTSSRARAAARTWLARETGDAQLARKRLVKKVVVDANLRKLSEDQKRRAQFLRDSERFKEILRVSQSFSESDAKAWEAPRADGEACECHCSKAAGSRENVACVARFLFLRCHLRTILASEIGASARVGSNDECGRKHIARACSAGAHPSDLAALSARRGARRDGLRQLLERCTLCRVSTHAAARDGVGAHARKGALAAKSALRPR
eukprot:2093182-Pleurochrysis_carterae.AAC.2